MKLKITAIAASVMLLSGGIASVNAAEVLKVDQMDIVTAGGNWSGDAQDWGRKGIFGHDRKGHQIKFGHWWWKGKWWDCKFKDDRGRVSFGKVEDVVKHEKPAVAGTTTTVGNTDIKIVADNGSIVNAIINIGSGTVTTGDITSNITPSAPPKVREIKDFGKGHNFGHHFNACSRC
jgi:hypothetical protein